MLWTYVIGDLNGEKIVGTFFERGVAEVKLNEFRIETVIKGKGKRLYFE